MTGWDVLALIVVITFFGWIAKLWADNIGLDPSPEFMCHGSWESQHFYQGDPPCPQCEADRAALLKRTRPTE